MPNVSIDEVGVVIHVPASRAVQKYIMAEHAHLEVQYRGNPALKLAARRYLGSLVVMSLTSELDNWKPQRIPKERITLILPYAYRRYAITPERLWRLSCFLRQEFKFQFVRFLNMYQLQGGRISDGIEEYYRKYGLEEDDLGRDTMRRYYNAVQSRQFLP